jgi:hypothetical protein
MRAEKKGQISTEYLIVVGFIILAISALLSVALFYTGGITDRIKLDQVNNYANKIIGSAEEVYYSGTPSRATTSVYLPNGVRNITFFDEHTIVVNVSTTSGENIISYKSNVPLNGSLSNAEGVKKIKLVAFSDRVTISDG